MLVSGDRSKIELKADRRDTKRIKKLAKQQRKSNIKSILLGIQARIKRSIE